MVLVVVLDYVQLTIDSVIFLFFGRFCVVLLQQLLAFSIPANFPPYRHSLWDVIALQVPSP